MKKFMKITVGLAVMMGFFACSDKVAYRIEGKLSNLQQSEGYAVFENDRGAIDVDTLVCDADGNFSLEQRQEGFNTVTLFFDNKTLWRCLYLEAGKKIKISGDAQYPALWQVKGGDKINEQLAAINQQSASLWKERTALLNEINHKQSHPIAEADAMAKLANVEHQLEEKAAAYVRSNPSEAASLALIDYFFVNPDDSRLVDELLAVLSPQLRTHYLYKTLEEFSARTRRTNIGAEAPSFKVKNIAGEEIDLAKEDNNYILLAFTDPWTAGGNISTSYLAPAVKKYEKDPLDVIVFSLDDACGKNLREMAHNDSIQWNLVTDSAGQVAALLDIYNVSELPRYYLIDKDKKILMKTENNLEVRDTLDELFAK